MFCRALSNIFGQYLIMDEADRLLGMDFEVEIDKILKVNRFAVTLKNVYEYLSVVIAKGEIVVSFFCDNDLQGK